MSDLLEKAIALSNGLVNEDKNNAAKIVTQLVDEIEHLRNGLEMLIVYERWEQPSPELIESVNRILGKDKE